MRDLPRVGPEIHSHGSREVVKKKKLKVDEEAMRRATTATAMTADGNVYVSTDEWMCVCVPVPVRLLRACACVCVVYSTSCSLAVAYIVDRSHRIAF
jgi:hypothetical protein